ITGTFRKGEVTEGMLRTLVAGEDLAIAGFRDRKSTDTGEVLRVESLQIEGRYRGLMAVKNVSFVSRADEILVITGISGNGQEELLESLFGMRRVLSGSVHLYDTDITGWTPADLRKIGVAALIGDRDTIASCAGLSIMDNVVLNRVRERFFLKERPLRTWTRELLSSYGVEYSSLDDLAGTLSGGNLQKTILAREISGNPHLILLSEPTRGLDVKHAEMVHRTLLSLKQNLSIVLFTGDLDEAISIADRILIMYDGEIVVDLPNTGEIGRSMLNRYLQGTAEVKNK
ncbi:MAG TPA: ATP-binding cassette domain-containing protein, partial [Mesotoga infera]|nr:ATP-binding cassette domain-containing protein [Mesotoga infera]